MAKRLIIAICILLTGQLFSQPTPQWTSSIGSNFPYYFTDTPKIKFDKSGDLIVCGNIMTGSNGKNMLLIKYSVSGSIIWLKTYNGVLNKDDEAIDLEIDNQNNIYVTGTTLINTNNSDIITVKFDSGGNFIWANTFNGYANRNDRSQSISLDASNNSYITGYTELDSSFAHCYLFLRKIDPIGNTVWTRRYGTDSLSRYLGYRIRINNSDIRVLGHYIPMTSYVRKYVALKLDLSGNVIFSNETAVTSGISSTANFIDKNGNYYFGAPVAYKTTKINQNGILAWKDSIPTNLPSNVSGDEIRALIIDSLQNIYTTGRHYGPNYNGPNYTNCDVLTVKYSPSGSIQWSKRYDYLGTNSCDIGNSICLDSSLNVYVGAESQRTNVATDYDYAVIKYNTLGTQMGTIRYNDPYSKDDAISSIITDKYGCIYVTGLTMDNLTTSNTTTQKYCSVNTGLPEAASDKIIVNAFPNPFNSEVFVDLPDTNIENLHLKIYNSTGQVVFEQFYSDTKRLKINPSSLSSGLYHFVIKSADRQYSGKLVKVE